MNFDLSDEQKMLGEQARALLSDMTPFDRLRTLIDSGAEWDEPLWRAMADMGLLGAAIAEEYGGLGLGALDLGVIMDALGSANAAVPFMSSIILAADAIALAGSEAQKSLWLPKLASGEAVATFAYAEGPGPVFAAGVSFKNGSLSGAKWPVADAAIADVAVVLVSDGRMALVELDQPGVARTKLSSFDQLRSHYRLDLTDAVAEAMPGIGMLDRLVERAAVQAAFEAVGAAEACLTMARDYALERQMFGRPLAGYQAIKHKLADVAVATELARSNAYYAGWAADYSPDDLTLAASAARLSAIKCFELAARENLQVHGGIGYTFEANCHFYYRRERMLSVNLGNRGFWADRLLKAHSSSEMKGA